MQQYSLTVSLQPQDGYNATDLAPYEAELTSTLVSQMSAEDVTLSSIEQNGDMVDLNFVISTDDIEAFELDDYMNALGEIDGLSTILFGNQAASYQITILLTPRPGYYAMDV